MTFGQDPWEKDFDEKFDKMWKLAKWVWILIAVAGLVLTCVVVWAIIELVQHFT